MIYMEKEYGRYPLSVIFPKTFAYLNFVVPVIRSEFLTQPLPDPIIILKDECIRGKSKGCYGFMDKSKREITFYLYAIMEGVTYFDRKKLDLDNSRNLRLFCKYVDTLPKLQSLVIHEYEHIIQNILEGNCLFSEELGINTLILENSITSGVFKDLAKSIYEEYKNVIRRVFYNRKTKNVILFNQIFYSLNPREVEARLSEIILWRFRGYDKETISKLDLQTNFFKIDLVKGHSDIEAIKSEIEDMKYKGFTSIKLQRNLSKLQEKLIILETYILIYDKLFEIVDRYVEILKIRKAEFDNQLNN